MIVCLSELSSTPLLSSTILYTSTTSTIFVYLHLYTSTPLLSSTTSTTSTTSTIFVYLHLYYLLLPLLPLLLLLPLLSSSIFFFFFFFFFFLYYLLQSSTGLGLACLLFEGDLGARFELKLFIKDYRYETGNHDWLARPQYSRGLSASL